MVVGFAGFLMFLQRRLETGGGCVEVLQEVMDDSQLTVADEFPGIGTPRSRVCVARRLEIAAAELKRAEIAQRKDVGVELHRLLGRGNGCLEVVRVVADSRARERNFPELRIPM